MYLRHYPSNSGKNTSKGVSHSRDGLDQTDVVEHESVQKVSKARAMFESMSSSNVNLDKSPSVARPNLKSWYEHGFSLNVSSLSICVCVCDWFYAGFVSVTLKCHYGLMHGMSRHGYNLLKKFPTLINTIFRQVYFTTIFWETYMIIRSYTSLHGYNLCICLYFDIIF